MTANEAKTGGWPAGEAGWVTAIISYVHGIYPHSEQLVTVTRDAARGRCSASGVARQRQADQRALVSVQQEAGLDYISSGLLDWQDLFRPLVAACPGWTAGPLRRWFDNNAFVRIPVVRGTVRLDRALLAAAGEVVTLPGPYTFSRIAGTDMDRDKLIGEVAAGVLRPAAEELISRGARLVQLQEPWLAAHGIAGHCWDLLAVAVGTVSDGLGVPVVVHTYFGDAGPWLDKLRELPADAIGVDLAETDVAALAGRWSTGLLAGCVNARSSIVEDPAAVAALARRIIQLARPPTLMLSSNCDLELLPRAVADRKTQVLGEVARLLRAEPAC